MLFWQWWKSIKRLNRSDAFTELVVLEAFTIFFSLKKEKDILLAIKHVKEVSKKKVTFAKTEQFTKRNKIEISAEELNRIIENLVNNGVIQMQAEY